VLSRRYRVDRTIASLDAVAGATNLDRYGEAVRQVAAADVVVLTKGDLAAADALKTLSDRVATLNPAATILTAERGQIDAGIVFDDDIAMVVPRSASRDHTSRAPPLHGEPGGVTSLTMTFAEPLDWRMLGLWLTMLLHRHGERILRVKGLLDTGEEGPLLLEGVQHVVHAPRHLAAWPDADRRTRLVFILREIDPGRVRQSLDAFRTLVE